MAKKKSMNIFNSFSFGSILFVIGIILAVISGLFSSSFSLGVNNVFVWILILLGLMIGMLNITAKETAVFLIATLTLLVTAGVLKLVPVFGNQLIAILNHVSYIIAAAALIVALEAIYALASK